MSVRTRTLLHPSLPPGHPDDSPTAQCLSEALKSDKKDAQSLASTRTGIKIAHLLGLSTDAGSHAVLFSENKSESRAKTILEDRFFGEAEKLIVQRLHADADSESGRAELIRATGINDRQLIDELAELGVTAEGLLALRLLPLVLVAWAEHHVDHQERVTIMAEAKRLGIQEHSVAWVLLDHWMHQMPSSKGIDAWQRYLRSVFATMSEEGREKLLRSTRQQMTAVAKASGGHLGIGKISRLERRMIEGLMLGARKQCDAASQSD